MKAVVIVLSLVFGGVLVATPPKAKATAVTARVKGKPTPKAITKHMREMFAVCDPFTTQEILVLQGYADDPEETLKTLKQFLAERRTTAQKSNLAHLDAMGTMPVEEWTRKMGSSLFQVGD